MKRILTPFVFLMLFLMVLPVCYLRGQNYQTVYLEREGFFDAEEFGLTPEGHSLCYPCRFGIRVDTIASDSQHYVFPTYWENEDYEQEATARASWLGDTLTFLNDGRELFRNKNGDTITLKPQTPLGGKWVMYELSSNTYLEAEVFAIDFQEVLGQMDSVKTIVLQARNTLGETIEHEMNGFILKIGQYSGFVEACDMFHFPKRMKEIYLVGSRNPDYGATLLYEDEIFDFNIGDERHYKDDHWFDLIEYRRYIVTDVDFINMDSVTYTFEILLVCYYYWFDQQTQQENSAYVRDTAIIQSTHHLTAPSYINMHPYEHQDVYTYLDQNEEGHWLKIISDNKTASLSHTWHKKYQKCLGEIDAFSWLEGSLFISRELVYYKKTNTEWGSPINFDALTATKEIQNPTAHLIAYPNPAQHNITITSRTGELKLQQIRVFNTLGLQVAEWDCGGLERSVHSVADFPTGTYWLLATDEDGGLWRLVFVKR
jgi:Secretion system C-terminal sorting domain